MRKRNKVRETLAEAVELPKEVALSMPKITVLAEKEATVENYKGVISISQEEIQLYTASGILRLSGKNLNIAAITDEDISIEGSILQIEFK